MAKEAGSVPDARISRKAWGKTPKSVRAVVELLVSENQALAARVDAALAQVEALLAQHQSMTQQVSDLQQRVAALETENQLLRERAEQSSRNSSQPPSADGPQVPKREGTGPTGKRRGAQPGHRGHQRSLFPVEACQAVHDHRPSACKGCGGALSGTDPEPYRHQTVELPVVRPIVEEHRLHQLTCQACGQQTRAELPEDVSGKQYGTSVAATTALVRALMRQSVRRTSEAMRVLFGVPLSSGTVVALSREVSTAVAPSVEAAESYLQQQPVVGMDETSFEQGNADGGNPQQRKGWLWVGVTPLVTIFVLALSRSADVAKAVLGEAFGGIVGSDQYGGYAWVDPGRRQLCWAHLLRVFQKMIERGAESAEIGTELLEAGHAMFHAWHRVRDGTLARSSFRTYVGPIRRKVRAALERGAGYEVKKGDGSARARTARTCARLVKMEAALWLFAREPGVEPTNNASERALRFAVIWRRISYGTQSEAGSQFVARMLTVIETLRQQRRDVLEFLTESCRAARANEPGPSLLPPAVPPGVLQAP